MRISVIMPVYLGEYALRATNPGEKFKRAVQSFINQTYKDAELIIVSDGCKEAEKIYEDYFSHYKSIRYRYIDKQPEFGGMVRQTGISMAIGEIICYLDSDDFIGVDHLKVINENFDTGKYDWVNFDDYVIQDANFSYWGRETHLEAAYIGTSNIAHKRILDLKWGDGYGHDWDFISQIINKGYPGIKIIAPFYYVCHRPGIIDF